jgi:hypothetical protein
MGYNDGSGSPTTSKAGNYGPQNHPKVKYNKTFFITRYGLVRLRGKNKIDNEADQKYTDRSKTKRH